MKKGTIITLTIVTLVITFIFAEIFSIYHFGNIPTVLTSLYLISIFAIFEFLSISITYIVRKLIRKEKLEIKKIIGLFLLFVTLLLLLLFLIVVNADYLNWYMNNSSPFYLNVIVKSVEFLIPSIVLAIISILIMKNKKKK